MPSWRQLSAQRGFYFFPGELGACQPVENNVGNWAPFTIPADYYSNPERYGFPCDTDFSRDAVDHGRPWLALYDYPGKETPRSPLVDDLMKGIYRTPRSWRETVIYGDVTAGALFFQALDVVLTLTPVITTRLTYLRTLAVALTLTPAIATRLTFLRTLAVTLTLVPGLVAQFIPGAGAARRVVRGFQRWLMQVLWDNRL